jgi:hypothetical protein
MSMYNCLLMTMHNGAMMNRIHKLNGDEAMVESEESALREGRQAALELQAEFTQWDRLSDEALEQFEKDLD